MIFSLVMNFVYIIFVIFGLLFSLMLWVKYVFNLIYEIMEYNIFINIISLFFFIFRKGYK